MSVGNHHEIAFEKISPCGLFNEMHTVFKFTHFLFTIGLLKQVFFYFDEKTCETAMWFFSWKLLQIHIQKVNEKPQNWQCEIFETFWLEIQNTNVIFWNCRGCFLKNWNRTPKEVSPHYGLNPWEPEVKKLWYSYYLPVFPSVCGGLLKKMLPFKVIFRNYNEKMG